MIDVSINIYGKPYQTIATLESLFKFSGQHVGKVFMTIETTVPHDDSMIPLLDYVKQKGIDVYTPNDYVFMRSHESSKDIRYQYGIDKSTGDYVFICHNDIKFTGDIIGEMLEGIKGIGIGQIGQCWNCPAFRASLCDGSTFEQFNPSYEQAVQLFKTVPPERGSYLNIESPVMPLPECRLNEFACLIDRRITVEEQANGFYFGLYDTMDLGVAWFRAMVLKGHKFTNYDISRTSVHGFWANDCGYTTEKSKELYFKAERNASAEINL
jgi:hypothetical protein